MASSRALVVLSGLALAMLVWVVVDDGGRPAAVSRPRLVVPEYSRVLVERVVWQRAGEPDVVLARRGEEFGLVAPIEAGADPAAVDDVLGTIEVLSFIRQQRASTVASLPGSVDIRVSLRGREPVRLSIGARLTSTDRVWIGRGERAYLVGGYAARALDRRADDLRARDVFPSSQQAITAIEIQRSDPGKAPRDLVLSGRPMRVHRDAGGKMLLDRELAARVLAAIDSLVLQRFVSEPIGTSEHQLRVRVLGAGGAVEISAGGPCPGAADLRLVETTIGRGCASATALDRIAELVGRGRQLFEQELAPPPSSIRAVEIRSGETISLRARGGDWITEGDVEAEAGAVRAWLEAFAALGAGDWTPVPAAPASPTTVIIITDATGGRDEVRIFRRNGSWWARRAGEPLMQRLGGRAGEIAQPSALDFRDRTLIEREPTSLISAKASRRGRVVAHVDRGLLLEEWMVRAPAGQKPDPKRIKRLRQTASHLRARRFVAGRPGPAHGLTPPRREIELLFEAAPTIGAKQALHRIALGASTPNGGCFGQLDGAPVVFELEAAACAVLRSTWSR